MARGDFTTALRLLVRARRGDEDPALMRGAALNIANNCGMALRDFERALDLCEMSPSEYFRHECAVAEILRDAAAPVQARIVELNIEPDFGPQDEHAATAAEWLDKLAAG